MIKDTPQTIAMQQYAETQAVAFERFMQEYIEPMADVGTPERVIGKPYAEWTEEDMQMLAKVYGAGLDSYMLSRELKAAKE